MNLADVAKIVLDLNDVAKVIKNFGSVTTPAIIIVFLI